jgi:hypothetical protein
MNQNLQAPGLLRSVLGNKCPHCRKGPLFLHQNPYRLKDGLAMPEHCRVCGQAFELQEGFYYGTGYVSYGLSVTFTGLCFIAWWLTAGISVRDNSIFWWLGVNTFLLLALQPLLQRLSRSIWIACFVPFRG